MPLPFKYNFVLFATGSIAGQWLSAEILSLFLFHEMRPLALHEEIHIVKSLVSQYIFDLLVCPPLSLKYYWIIYLYLLEGYNKGLHLRVFILKYLELNYKSSDLINRPGNVHQKYATANFYNCNEVHCIWEILVPVLNVSWSGAGHSLYFFFILLSSSLWIINCQSHLM